MSVWRVALSHRGRIHQAIQALEKLDRVVEVYAPMRSIVIVSRGARVERQVPWLGGMVLTRWDGDDVLTWHDVVESVGVVGVLGRWPPATVRDEDVERFRASIEALDGGSVVDNAPCAPGDLVRFTWGAFYRVVARCVWAGGGIVGLRVRMLGSDQLLQVPYEFVSGVERVVVDDEKLGKQRRKGRYLRMR